jgi:hypothetical protein
MAATCAACAQPIVGGRFVLAGSEALHKSCALAGKKTVLWNLREANEKNIEWALREKATATAAAHSLEVALEKSRRDELKVTQQYTQQWRAANAELSRLQQVVRTQEDAIANLQRQLAEAKAQAALPPVQPVAAPAQPSHPTASAHVGDDTAARFALLEFD